MREIFHAELAQVGHDLDQMSTLVESAIRNAGTALLTPDLALAQTVIADDSQIDTLQSDLDERCVLLLAQQQPVATDLRVIVSAMRMSASLERMGDLARHIAEIARRRFPHAAVGEPFRETFTRMDAAAVHLAERVTRLLSDHDLGIARRIKADDDLLDDLHEGTFAQLLDPARAGSAQETIDVTLLSRFYERFGDHGVSVAAKVTFLVGAGQRPGSAPSPSAMPTEPVTYPGQRPPQPPRLRRRDQGTYHP